MSTRERRHSEGKCARCGEFKEADRARRWNCRSCSRVESVKVHVRRWHCRMSATAVA